LASLSGYNTRWAKIVLPRIVSAANPAQHVPLQEFTENLKDILKYLVSIGVSNDKIIFITPPPLQETAWEKECLLKGSALNRLNSVAGQYAQACVQAAGQSGVDVLDLWTLMQKDGQVTHMLAKP
uniref:Isoamyl acetate-hydrolyzing esterase 1 homolog n=1 Tax=Sinocyclocheilus rhinocerous TaxID=307959 RepID=A0A673LYI6_9TELE